MKPQCASSNEDWTHAVMINVDQTFVYPNWLPSLLKFDWQRVHAISETALIQPLRAK
jgi:hypothetical protein